MRGRALGKDAKRNKVRTGSRDGARMGPRAGARALLAGLRDGMTLTDQVAMGVLDRLSGPDRARAQRLAALALRHLGRADAVLAPLLARRPRPAVMDVLHLATVEMLEAGEAAHGVVNDAVAAVRAQGQKGQAAAGMVNAVLRKAAVADWAAIPPQRLPQWLRAPVVAAYGEAATRAIEAAHQAGALLDLTAKGDAQALAAAVEGRMLPTGTVRLAAAQVSELAGYAEGAFWVQDAAAALAVRALDPQPGEEVLDLCAAPGGKTMQLAAAGARVTALDISAGRLARLADNLARTRLEAVLIEGDALAFTPDRAPDAILLDAPCSATGTIRRHPDLPLLRDGSALAEICALQAAMLDHALAILRPGGRLVYATCSLLPSEGEDQIAAALARHPGVTVERVAIPGTDPGWHGPLGLRLRPDFWPDEGGMDGFFIARLRKPAAAR